MRSGRSIEIKTTSKFGDLGWSSMGQFMQQMVNRIIFGHARYGSPNRQKRYMTRIEKELKAYKETGNREHLINVANYAWLESDYPEHKKHNFNLTVGSVTRGKV